MNRSILLILTILSFAVTANAQAKKPLPSTKQIIKQDFGVGTIELTYSRPDLRGRKMIGTVEPWDSVWRTGANEATKIVFSNAVEIDGKQVPAGAYALYTIPRKDGNWIFILNKAANSWGAFTYKKADDVLRTPVKAAKNDHKVETLTMQFSDVHDDSIILNIVWEDFALHIPIKTKI